MNASKYLTLIITLFASFDLFSAGENEFLLQSPDNRTEVVVYVAENSLFYRIHFDSEVVLKDSPLGLITDKVRFFNNFISLRTSGEPIERRVHYDLPNGKVSTVDFCANELNLWAETEKGGVLKLEFSVSNNGVAFCYEIPVQRSGDDDPLWRIEEEKTGFVFPEGTTSWIQPMAEEQTGWSKTQPSYEENYVRGASLETLHDFQLNQAEVAQMTGDLVNVYPYAGWIFPALFKTNSQIDHEKAGHWVLLSETGLQPNYCGCRLIQDGPTNAFQIGFPMNSERVFEGPVSPESLLPWKTPWRIIAVGDSLSDIVNSTLGTDYAEPALDLDYSWVEPGKASWSWVGLKDESITFEIQEQFIRYAAEMGWEYTLIDVNWDEQIGYDGIQKLVDLGHSLGVGIILWYNSSGPWNETPYRPKSKLLTAEDRDREFARISGMGVKGVKIDFFPGDGQSVIQYYYDLFEAAAKYKLMVNTHGTTLPRGWQRTFPNLVTMESVRGMEFVTFTQENADIAPVHIAILPFTRNVFDPMDFTPMMFSSIPEINKHTLDSFELALPVLFQSGIQHFAETAEGMKQQSGAVKDFLRHLPVVWDEIELLDGFPGEHVVLGRRKGKKWYIAGINSTSNTREYELTLPDTKQGQIVKCFVEKQSGGLEVNTLKVGENGTVRFNIQSLAGIVIHY